MRLKRVVLALLLVLVGSCFASAAEKRPVTVEDCVCTRRIVNREIALSPTGLHVAYVIKAPDVKTNKNNYQLLVRDLRQTTKRKNGRMLFQAEFLAGIRWLPEGRQITVLSREGEKNSVRIIDLRTGRSELAVEHPSRIEEYSISANGDVVVFSAKLPVRDDRQDLVKRTRGFPVTFGQPVRRELVQHSNYEGELYAAERTTSGERRVRRLEFSGLGLQREGSLQSMYGLNLSPDGSYLLFKYRSAWLPEGWETYPFVRRLQEISGKNEVYLPALYDLRSGQLRLAFNAPDGGGAMTWAEDSRAFAIQINSPIGSPEYQEEEEAGFAKGEVLLMRDNIPLFAVAVENGSFTRVLSKLPRAFWAFGGIPISWNRSDGTMLVRLDGKTLAWMEPQGSDWKEVGRTTALLTSNNTNYSTVSNGGVVVGVSETMMVPPELSLNDIKTNEAILLTDLNPEFRETTLGSVEELEWADKYGTKTTGYLIKPADYKAGKRYPLVMLTKGWSDTFICDTGHQTAFPPQPLANAGFVVLMANDRSLVNKAKGYPGDMGEAYSFIAMVESAVELLVGQGLADRSKVGLIGFSRTAWLTDFMLTHSDFRFAAASSADGGNYSYGSYWVDNWEATRVAWETQLGGPPYGETFQYWLKYAPAFNAENVQTPLLMEYISGSSGETEPYWAYEFFTALKRQDKPVELYFYPQGAHVLDTPFERVASLQRNVDWFRFWLQGCEGKAPAYDPEQYIRWRELRQQHQENPRKLAVNQRE